MYVCAKWLVVCFFCCLNAIGFAQTDSLTESFVNPIPSAVLSDSARFSKPVGRKRHADSLYVRHYPTLLTLGLFTATPYMSIGMSPLTDSLSNYGSAFEGNYSGALGFSFGYRTVGFSYGVRLPLDPIGEGQMGKSSFKIFSIKIKKLPFNISLDYRRYKGFYDANAMEYTPTATKENPYSIRPDLTFRTYSGNLICNFSWRKYSYTAPINYAERQLRTRVGFLMKGAVSYLQLFSDSAFISNYQIAYFPDFYPVKSIDAIVLKTGPGLGLNLVLHIAQA